MLVDLALIDNDFSLEEHDYLKTRLCDFFNISLTESYKLMEEAAELVQENMKVESITETIKSNSIAEERERLLKIMQELITADNIKSSFETHLMKRYEKLIGVRLT